MLEKEFNLQNERECFNLDEKKINLCNHHLHQESKTLAFY